MIYYRSVCCMQYDRPLAPTSIHDSTQNTYWWNTQPSQLLKKGAKIRIEHIRGLFATDQTLSELKAISLAESLPGSLRGCGYKHFQNPRGIQEVVLPAPQNQLDK